MGMSIMRLVTLWLALTAEAFRVHGASKHSAKGIQGGHKRGRDSNEVATDNREATDVCSPTDSAATCRNLSSKYRGGGIGPADSQQRLNIIKVLLQVCLTTLNVVCWFLPMKIRSFVESKRAISMANAFSGGVFLSLAFGHMLPHSNHGFHGSGLPESLPYFLTLSGYMLIFFVEKVAFDTHQIMHEGKDGHGDGHAGALPAPPLSDVKPSDSVSSVSSVSSHQGPPSGRSATILLLALGVHALMETMALGLSPNTLSAGLLAMSIGLHQPAESLALLVSFLKSGLSEKQIVRMLSIFSCIGPLGLGIGIAISEFAGQLADAVLVAMAAGTFIYVGATEVIAEEFEDPQDKWKKFFALTGGIIIIAFITNWAESLEGRAHL